MQKYLFYTYWQITLKNKAQGENGFYFMFKKEQGGIPRWSSG